MPDLRPGDGVGAPSPTAHPDHQPIVPTEGGVPPRCTCGLVGGNGINKPLLADHLREMDPTYGDPEERDMKIQKMRYTDSTKRDMVLVTFVEEDNTSSSVFTEEGWALLEKAILSEGLTIEDES